MSSPRALPLLVATTVVGLVASIVLYLDNRDLRAALAIQATAAPASEAPALITPAAPAPVARTERTGSAATSVAAPPRLPDEKEESRMERRARRSEEFAAKFGRLPNETDEEYRARVMPMIQLALVPARMRVAEMRRVAEEKAKVTAAQSAELDKAFAQIYDEALDYTNKAILDGQLSPYERNVAGWLDYAGGLGGIMTNANGAIGKILQPGQLQAMYDAGFEWSEYLGVSVPWENLTPPPPPPTK